MFSVKDQRVTFLPSWATWCLLQTPSSAFWHEISQAKYINGKTDRSLSDGSIRVLLFLRLWVEVERAWLGLLCRFEYLGGAYLSGRLWERLFPLLALVSEERHLACWFSHLIQVGELTTV